jgi:hypothetical protein
MAFELRVVLLSVLIFFVLKATIQNAVMLIVVAQRQALLFDILLYPKEAESVEVNPTPKLMSQFYFESYSNRRKWPQIAPEQKCSAKTPRPNHKRKLYITFLRIRQKWCEQK